MLTTCRRAALAQSDLFKYPETEPARFETRRKRRPPHRPMSGKSRRVAPFTER